MAVMQCDRLGCHRVLCPRSSSKHGYICDTCFDELVKLGVGANVTKFMSQERQIEPLKTRTAEEFFGEIFTRWDEKEPS